MRLLHASSLKFREFADNDIPPYAILSHTWADKQEVTLQDMASLYLTDKTGHAKITATCRLALARGLEWAWIDTCCIDKTNNTELTESINSMFHWYEAAAVCFVYLADLLLPDVPTPKRNRLHREPATMAPDSSGSNVGSSTADEIRRCAWFKRGWTLQELLAPHTVEFYDTRWNLVGSKTELAPLLTKITRIPEPAILGEEPLARYSTAQRMAWASLRVTTRVEDAAYCLLGLFDVNMPLIYGEGRRAFQRLQEEIVKRSTDLTLFAWLPSDPDTTKTTTTRSGGGIWDGFMPLLASSPSQFKDCHNLSQFRNDDSEFTVTNRGLRITTYLLLVPLSLDVSEASSLKSSSIDSIRSSGSSSNIRHSSLGGRGLDGGGGGASRAMLRKRTVLEATTMSSSSSDPRYRYVLSVGYIKSPASEIGIWLKKTGPGLFVREVGASLVHLSQSMLKDIITTESHTLYILMHLGARGTAGAASSSHQSHGSGSAVGTVIAASTSAPGGVDVRADSMPSTSFASAASSEATAALTAADQQLRTVYHSRLFPRGLHIPFFSGRGISFSSFAPNSWDERTRIFCQPESRNDVVAFSCSSHQGPDGSDNLSFGVLVDYREKRALPPCLVIDRHSLESRFLFVLSMRQQSEPVRWYVMENELPTISASSSVLRMPMPSSGRTYDVEASIVKGPVQIDGHMVLMQTLDIKITPSTAVGINV